MSKKSQAVNITSADIQQALKKFQKKGGLIKRLPDEDTPPRRLVGFRYGTYELVSEGFEVVGS